jgi:hypothetical protein
MDDSRREPGGFARPELVITLPFSKGFSRIDDHNFVVSRSCFQFDYFVLNVKFRARLSVP